MIDPSAQVHPSARVHPTAVIGAHSVIGADCRLDPYAVVGPHTQLGPRCHVFSFAVVGGPAQDRRTDPDAPFRLICGADNRFREGSTLSRGTAHGGETTRVGDGGLFMAHAHVGHDCQLGDHVTLANGVSLAGHVEVGDRVSLGGHAAVHQFCRLGALAFIAANAMISRDVPPYCLAAGDRARLNGLNRVGLERAGLSPESRRALHRAYRQLLRAPRGRQHLGPHLEHADPHVRRLARFLVDAPRGITPARRG